MKKLIHFLLWILGIFAWFFMLITFWAGDITHGRNTHLFILVISGICFAIYLLRNNKIKQLEEENADLKKKLHEIERKNYITSLVNDSDKIKGERK